MDGPLQESLRVDLGCHSKCEPAFSHEQIQPFHETFHPKIPLPVEVIKERNDRTKNGPRYEKK